MKLIKLSHKIKIYDRFVLTNNKHTVSKILYFKIIY